MPELVGDNDIKFDQFPVVPRSYHSCTDSSVIGKPFFVTERRRGWVIRAEWPGPYHGNDARRRRLAGSLATAEAGARYAARTGFDVNNASYYEGVDLFPIAAISEQIYTRYGNGQTSDQRFARSEPIAPILAAAGCEVLG